MMRTTGLLVVFTLFVVLYQTSAVPVASSYKLENENVMDVMEAKDKSEEAGDEEKEEEEETDKDEEKHDDKEEEKDTDKEDDDESKDDEEKKDEEDKKDDEETKDDEEKKEDKEEEEQEPELNEEQNDQESSGEESVDLDSDHLVLQGSGNGKIKGVVIEDSEKESDKPEKRSIDEQKKPSKSAQEKRCGCGGCGGCGDAFDSGGCDYMGGCGGAPGGVYGPGGGCGGCGCGAGPSCCGTNDWCAGGTMCSNCKGGFGPPITCSGCNSGCCPSLTFPCAFGATVNNPACECCKEKTPPGLCKWPCMWPCCCTCTPPKFVFKPLEPKPVCHCPSPHSHHTACGSHCLKRTKSKKGPVKRSLMKEQRSAYMPVPYSYGYVPFYDPFFQGVPMLPFLRPF